MSADYSTPNETARDDSSDCSESLDNGVWFRSACSGLWYRNAGAAGTIQAVRVDGKDFLPMPYRLTAENGAKAVLIGEFHIKVEHIDRETDETYVAEHAVPWTTIKQIYDNAVRWFLHDCHRET